MNRWYTWLSQQCPGIDPETILDVLDAFEYTDDVQRRFDRESEADEGDRGDRQYNLGVERFRAVEGQ